MFIDISVHISKQKININIKIKINVEHIMNLSNKLNNLVNYLKHSFKRGSNIIGILLNKPYHLLSNESNIHTIVNFFLSTKHPQQIKLLIKT